MKSLILLISLLISPLSLEAEKTQTPTLIGGYEALQPAQAPFCEMIIKKDGKLSLFEPGGREVIYEWFTKQNLLIVQESGYYIKWEKPKNSYGWLLKLTPAFDELSEPLVFVKRW